MIDNIILLLLQTNSFIPQILLTLGATKLFLFAISKKRSWKSYNIIYFGSKQLILSHSSKSYKNKKLQNQLTAVIVGVFLWQQVLLFLSGFLNLHGY